MRPTDKELLLGVADAVAALAATLGPSEQRVQLQMAAAIVRRVGSRLGQARAIIIADCEDMAATLTALGPPAGMDGLADVARDVATALPASLAEVGDEELEALHEKLQRLLLVAQRAVVADGGPADAAIRAFHRRSLERRAVLDHPFSA